MARLQQK